MGWDLRSHLDGLWKGYGPPALRVDPSQRFSELPMSQGMVTTAWAVLGQALAELVSTQLVWLCLPVGLTC